jgi:hypothetical protein
MRIHANPDPQSKVLPVAEVDTHLGGHAEESGDEVVSFEKAVHVHLLHEHRERLQNTQINCHYMSWYRYFT